VHTQQIYGPIGHVFANNYMCAVVKHE